jgi:small subunit ribosomal protein S16
MPVRLRLARFGRRKRPFYRIVAADARAPRDGRFIEIVGYYDPLTEPMTVKIDHEKALKWLKNGAQPTETVRSLLSREGILLKFHLFRKGKSEEEIEAIYQKWREAKEQKLQREREEIKRKQEKNRQNQLELEKQARMRKQSKKQGNQPTPESEEVGA